MPHVFHSALRYGLAGAAAALAALLAGCQSTPLPPESPVPAAPGTPTAANPPPPAAPARPPARSSVPPSYAATPRDYRRDGAQHLYQLNTQRIYTGKLPPMLYAIGVLETQLDSRGQVVSLHWLRAPKHAPEVVAEIERTVRAASPFPAPARLGKVVYTDTWLWDESGRFQLDTLTEGQE